MPVIHNTVAAGTNDSGKQVSVTAWNEDHVIDSYLDFPELASAPGAPLAGIRLYAHNMSGRRLLDITGPSGVDVSLQPALFGNNICLFLPNTGTTAAINFGTPWTNTANTVAHPTIAATSLLTSMKRTTFQTGTTSGTTGGVRAAAPLALLSSTQFQGGFFFFSRFAMEVYVQAATQLAVGMTASTTNNDLSGQPSSRFNHISVGKDSADTTWQLMRNDGTGVATKINSGVTMAAGDIIDVFMFASPGLMQVTVSVRRVNDNLTLFNNEILDTDIPASGTLLYPMAQCRNATGSSITLAVNRLYLETDL